VYKPADKTEDEELKKLLLELSALHPRNGFKKLYGMIRNKGHKVNHKRLYRLYCELKLNLKRKVKKRLPPRVAKKLTQPEKINISWSLDFMSDALFTGKRFRTVNVIDDFNRECLGIEVGFSIPSTRVTRWLENIALLKGSPHQIRVDNGPEYISSHFQQWAKQRGIFIDYIQPGKPAQNGYIERFNRTYREEVLDMYLFKNLQEVQAITNDWLNHYNDARPHEALGLKTPNQMREIYLQNSI
jgi:putative transposase